MISVLPATYRNFKFYNGKRCSTSPYTYDLGADPPCNGFHNMNEYECQAACENSNVASGCPEKLCVASVFYPSTKECHLYESCPSLVDDANARTIRARVVTKERSVRSEQVMLCANVCQKCFLVMVEKLCMLAFNLHLQMAGCRNKPTCIVDHQGSHGR